MARTDNFEHFLTDVADAIREKTGITHTLSPASYDTLIRSILPVENTPDDSVRFIDYDGTIVYSFKKHDFLMRTEMPALPEHLGLVNTGWNWSLDGARRQVARMGCLDIGCQYYTADETFRIVLDIPTDNCEISLYCYNGAINWGDGSELEEGPFKYNDVSGDAGHIYTKAGRYTIAISRTSSYCDIRTGFSRHHWDDHMIVELYYPEYDGWWRINVTAGINIEKFTYDPDPNLDDDNPNHIDVHFPLAYLGKLKHLLIPANLTTSWDFFNPWGNDTIPPREEYREILKENGWVDSETGKIHWAWWPHDTYLETLSISELPDPDYDNYPCTASFYTQDSYTWLEGDWFRFISPYMTSLRLPYHKSITMMPDLGCMYLEDYNDLVKNFPDTITYISGGHLCDAITQYTQTIYLPDSVTYIDRGFLDRIYLYNSCRLTVMMPENLEYIGPYLASYSPSSYYGTDGTLILDFRKVKQVVTLGDIDYSGEPDLLYETTKLVVPDELYEDWIAATNWATYYKDNIVPVSVYDASLES